jgi:Nucleotidyl transferase AbiEii toxin, Type IV TA system
VRSSYRDLLAAHQTDRAGVYQEATEVWATSPDLIEKDLMVCATLDVLFGDISDATSTLVFKGGTSLSKAHKLIQRFSEDVDLVVVRETLGFTGKKDPMVIQEGVSGKQRTRLVDELKHECARYIAENIVPQLKDAFEPLGGRIEIVPDDPQTVLVHYDTALTSTNAYNPPSVKIEGGARSATLPAHAHDIAPYVASVLDNPDLMTPGVVTIDAGRTFLDKLLLLHGRHCYFRDRGTVYKDANRESRHYYDLAMMADTNGSSALSQPDLLADVIHHSRLAFPSGWAKFDEAERGDLLIMPPEGMRKAIARDYGAMQGMIFGVIPKFDDILGAIEQINQIYNKARP